MLAASHERIQIRLSGVRPAHQVRFVAGRHGDGLPDVLPESHRAPGPASAAQKFILTGSQVTEKRTSTLAAAGPAVPERQAPVAAIFFVLVLLLLAAGAGVFFFGGGIFRRLSAGGWQTDDVGGVGAAGSFSRTDNVFTVSGSGADIWFQADAFRYVFQTLNDRGTLTARVLNQQDTDIWAKAGVMIRESLNPDSPYAMAFVTPSSGLAFQQRSTAAGLATSVLIVPWHAAPCWLRLEREGNTFTAFYSANGTAWTAMGSTVIPMGSQVYAGLAVCSHNYAVLSQAQFDHVTLKTNLVAAPKPVAPPASDTNWMLALAPNAIPDSPVAGRIHGQDFIVERASFQNGTLTLRAGTGGPVEFGVFIHFGSTPPEVLAGHTINVTTNAGQGGARYVALEGRRRHGAKGILRRRLRAAAGIRRAGEQPAAGENLSLHAGRGKKLLAWHLQRRRAQAQGESADAIVFQHEDPRATRKDFPAPFLRNPHGEKKLPKLFVCLACFVVFFL